jgi:alkylation response protein AidB-like acyl-CoA dehydrogenase
MEELGRELVASPLLSAILAVGCLRRCDEDQAKLATEVVEGRAIVALAAGVGEPHSAKARPCRADRSGTGFRVSGRKSFVIDGHIADRLIVSAQMTEDRYAGPATQLFLVDPASPGVVVETARLVDGRPYAHVTLDGAPGEPIGGPPRMLDAVLDEGAVVLAAEMLGGAARVLELTVRHLQDRRQFGVPLASFQALQHRVARLAVAVEVTGSVVAQALRALDSGEPDAADAASTAKAYAGETFRLATAEAVQLHGGLGITDECDVGLYLKRARVTEKLLGDGVFHRRRFAARQGF